VIVVVIIVAVVVVLAGGALALRFAHRSDRAAGTVAGEPAPRAAEPDGKPAPPETTATATEPSIDETIADLEARLAPQPDVVPDVTPIVTPEELEQLLEEPVREKPRLRDRLGRTRAALAGAFGGLRGRKIDDDTWDDLEEAMLLADVGLPTTQRILEAVRARAKDDKITDGSGLVDLVQDEVIAILDGGVDRELHEVAGEPNVWMFVGVNGVGKTTTIGKLASQQVGEGKRVVLAAADTFRAAAADQLGLWAERTGGELVRGQDGADPGSVVFDAMAAASSRGADLVLVDTAGRLHTKSNLMEELKKLRRIVDRTEGACKEVLLVIDASTGQNGLVQAKQFADTVDVTGIVLTKLDGTAKGGIVLAIQSELGLPVKVVGVGEGVDDLVDFDPREFAAAIFAADEPE
jgi:fused signal recognition particle receptor